jgi:hypothetical protein
MENKGLCSTCIHDKDCAFTRKFPVWHCEEFSNYEPKPKKLKNKKGEVKYKFSSIGSTRYERVKRSGE